ncbi:putative calcium-binding protein CML21 [Panicum miliaceum]|uniref:Calcium-binding protein CML21 n=1 Tax=Panicum miliaceum TaxID=4540 RepID=A0A3L6QJE4_PANMI|nr:putative calcium-binding protein CML21 [Panicum miliaceum]
MGGVIGGESPRNSSPASKLERKMVEAMQQRALKGTSVKSFNSVIMKFPKIDESLRNCRTIFQQFDEDSNGEIDQQELKHCFQKLGIESTDDEIKDLFQACDIYEHMGMKFNEFIVFLCLVYLLNDPAVSEARKRMGLGCLEPTFETLVESFVFLDKNKDGYVSKNEMIQAINETTAGERSSGRIGVKRFEEMDWDKNGTVTFKEFLFAFTRWPSRSDSAMNQLPGLDKKVLHLPQEARTKSTATAAHGRTGRNTEAAPRQSSEEPAATEARGVATANTAREHTRLATMNRLTAVRALPAETTFSQNSHRSMAMAASSAREIALMDL